MLGRGTELSGAKHDARPNEKRRPDVVLSFDPKSDQSKPRWFMVDVKLVKKFKRLIPMDELRAIKALKNMVLFNNSRLSVQPVTKKEFETIEALAKSG